VLVITSRCTARLSGENPVGKMATWGVTSEPWQIAASSRTSGSSELDRHTRAAGLRDFRQWPGTSPIAMCRSTSPSARSATHLDGLAGPQYHRN